MIGKQTKGKSFIGVLEYLEKRDKAELIGGNMAGKTADILAAEFKISTELNPKLSKAVYHASLSLPNNEKLNNEIWQAIALDYLKGMGFDGSQYVVYRHEDKKHDHIHIVASRIKVTDGSTVNDSWDYRRSEKQIRELEHKYELTTTPLSQDSERRRQTSGELRQIERTGEKSTRVKLQTLIDEATKESLTMPKLINCLKDWGIDALVSYTRTGKVKGISYQLEGIAFSGTHLGKAYTFNGVQKYRGIIYEKSQDKEIRIACKRQPALELRKITKVGVKVKDTNKDKDLKKLKRRQKRAKFELELRQSKANRSQGIEIE